MNTAFVFPGQGSQYVGMGLDLYESYPEIKELFIQADEILGYGISEVCFRGPEEKLKQTYITQPAILLHSVAAAKLVSGKKCSFTAGHSLGEFSALIYAGSLSFENGLKLVKLRGELMQKAGEMNKGTMAAVIGVDQKTIEEVCLEASAGGIVQPANFNSPGQVVISGSVEGVRRAMVIAKERGAKLVKELVVHGAFHSPLMESAKEDFKAALENTEFSKVNIPLYANVSAMPVTGETGIKQIKESLSNQLTFPVRWEESIRNMIKDGADEFIELGPGKVLQGLIKRIDGSVSISGIDKAADIIKL